MYSIKSFRNWGTGPSVRGRANNASTENLEEALLWANRDLEEGHASVTIFNSTNAPIWKNQSPDHGSF